MPFPTSLESCMQLLDSKRSQSHPTVSAVTAKPFATTRSAGSAALLVKAKFNAFCDTWNAALVITGPWLHSTISIRSNLFLNRILQLEPTQNTIQIWCIMVPVVQKPYCCKLAPMDVPISKPISLPILLQCFGDPSTVQSSLLQSLRVLLETSGDAIAPTLGPPIWISSGSVSQVASKAHLFRPNISKQYEETLTLQLGIAWIQLASKNGTNEVGTPWQRLWNKHAVFRVPATNVV